MYEARLARCRGGGPDGAKGGGLFEKKGGLFGKKGGRLTGCGGYAGWATGAGVIPDRRGLATDFIREAIQHGWWNDPYDSTNMKFTNVKRHAFWFEGCWHGDACCVALAEVFCDMLSCNR